MAVCVIVSTFLAPGICIVTYAEDADGTLQVELSEDGSFSVKPFVRGRSSDPVDG